MSEPTIATPSKRFQCRHIFAGGHRCGSPSLRGEHFCYYHHSSRRAAQSRMRDLGDKESVFELPLPEDRSAIQVAIGEVLQRIAAESIDNKRAGLLLYGLQIASSNLPKANARDAEQPAPIDRYTTDLILGDLAPASPFEEAAEDDKAAAAEEVTPATAEDSANVSDASAPPTEQTPEISTESGGFEAMRRKQLQIMGRRLRPGHHPENSVPEFRERFHRSRQKLLRTIPDNQAIFDEFDQARSQYAASAQVSVPESCLYLAQSPAAPELGSQ